MAPQRRREDRKRLRRYFEKRLAAESDPKRCADCTCLTTFRSMTSALICVNQTIYCLLIQPNPDSALNATAGHLLQDDYDSFARQARLMTSIHARIPSDLKDLALSARKWGGITGTAMGEDIGQRPTMESQSTSLLPGSPMGELPDCVTYTQSALLNLDQALKGEILAKEDQYATSAPKEIDPLPSPSPVLASSPHRPATAKRPVSDLHVANPEHDMTEVPCLSPSERNVVNNILPLTSIAAPDRSRKGLQIAGKSQTVNRASRGQETGDNGTSSDDIEGNPTKRLYSDSGKENAIETWGTRKPIGTPLPAVSAATKLGVPIPRKASASAILATNRMKGKSRVGLRRL